MLLKFTYFKAKDAEKTCALICGTASALTIYFNKETTYAGKLPEASEKLLKFMAGFGLSENDLERALSSHVQRWKSMAPDPGSGTGKEKKDKKEKVKDKNKEKEKEKKKGQPQKAMKNDRGDDSDDDLFEEPNKKRRRTQKQRQWVYQMFAQG